MTELIINGTKAVLPSNFSFTMYDENPYVTKRGQFSLDISLSLKNKINSRIFKHIDRLNNTVLIADADAILVVNSEITKGRIIDVENTDSEVTFQFVAGNSEINWLGDKKIWDFDWGTETAIDFDKAKRSINFAGYGSKSYEVLAPGGMSYYPQQYVEWENNYVCCPVKCKGETQNLVLNLISYDDTFDANINLVSITNICMQPYLLYYVNKLPELLGYSIKSNILNSDKRALRMYLVNAVDSLNYSDALPDMSISDFISAVEKFFNVVFYFDSITKEVNIISLSSFVNVADTVKLNNVIDKYERKYDSKSKIKNISYSDLPDTYFFKYQKLNDDVKTKIQFLHFPQWTDIVQHFASGNPYEYLDMPIVYVDDSTAEEYIFAYPADFDFYKRTIGYGEISLINKFKNYILDENGTDSLELKIVPASIDYIEVPVKYRYLNQDSTVSLDIQIPYASVNRYTALTQKIKDLVEKGVDDIPRINYLEAAFYVSNYTDERIPVTCKYPLSCIDERFDRVLQVDNFELDYIIAGASELTFRIAGNNGIADTYYAEGNIVSYENEYYFKFSNSKKVFANKIVEHNNLKYLPISLEKEISVSGLNRLITGKFYKLL